MCLPYVLCTNYLQLIISGDVKLRLRITAGLVVLNNGLLLTLQADINDLQILKQAF